MDNNFRLKEMDDVALIEHHHDQKFIKSHSCNVFCIFNDYRAFNNFLTQYIRLGHELSLHILSTIAIK